MENKLTEQIIGSAIEVHRELGPGLLESAYRECLKHLLLNNGIVVESEKPQPLFFRDLKLEQGYRIDLLVDRKVVVELKCVEALNDVHLTQILTYMKLGNYPLGLLINFNVKLLNDGIKRVILKNHK
jgi:GxxExxY protein